MEDSIHTILKMYLGDDKGHKAYIRWINWLNEVVKRDVAQIEKSFQAVEDSVYDELIVIRDIDVDMVCPHHLLPVKMFVNIGYLPDGKILGLSKFARVAREMAKPPLTQEEYTQLLMLIIQEKLMPKWVIVTAIGEHSCMQCRGVKAKFSDTITSAISSKDEQYNSLKNEFMHLVDLRGMQNC